MLFMVTIMICRNGSYPSLSGETNVYGVVWLTANYTYFKVDINPNIRNIRSSTMVESILTYLWIEASLTVD